MIKTCPICAKHFETHDKRKKYCRRKCAKRAKIRQNSECNKRSRDEKRINWAYNEAEKIRLMSRQGKLDSLDEYIYNNYRKRRKTMANKSDVARARVLGMKYIQSMEWQV